MEIEFPALETHTACIYTLFTERGSFYAGCATSSLLLSSPVMPSHRSRMAHKAYFNCNYWDQMFPGSPLSHEQRASPQQGKKSGQSSVAFLHHNACRYVRDMRSREGCRLSAPPLAHDLNGLARDVSSLVLLSRASSGMSPSLTGITACMTMS